MWNLENGTHEPICRAGRQTGIERTTVWTSRFDLPSQGDKLGDWH